MTRPKGEGNNRATGPLKVTYADDFPSDADLKILRSARDAVTCMLQASEGYTMHSCSAGVGGTDVALGMPDGRTMRVLISIEDRPNLRKAA